MPEWEIDVFGNQTQQPQALDTTSSPCTVYERRNIRRDTIEHAQGEDIVTVEGWRYDERAWPREQYEALQLALNGPQTEVLMQKQADQEITALETQIAVEDLAAKVDALAEKMEGSKI